jgi:arylsulfatase A-like enzyme
MKNKSLSRRDAIKTIGLAATATVAGCNSLAISPGEPNADKQPNIILVMSDDQGWGDVGYNGNPILKTPHLDRMAAECLRFDRFYAAAPVCSPTRGSCLTGRHPYRYGIPWAGQVPLRREEVTLAEALKTAGYATGHFGKWHLGSLSKTIKQTYFPGEIDPATYSPPWEHGFDECFSTEASVPTYNPYYLEGGEFEAEDYRYLMDRPIEKGSRTGGHRWRDFYWTGPGQIVNEWLEGDDSEIIMDRALEFIQRRAGTKQPFLSIVWFHTPHTPVVAGNKDRALYSDEPMEAQHWYGSITAMDRQIGRLRQELREMGIADDTIVWFCSDNGPSYIHDWNSAGPLKGKKATLWEGGIRVPAILEWPQRFKQPRIINASMCTNDFYPTLINLASAHQEHQPPLDGIDVMPILGGEMKERPTPIAFQSPMRGKRWQVEEGKESMVVIDNRYKLASFDGGKSFQLYDLLEDVGETTDVSSTKPLIVEKLKMTLRQWQKSCETSANREDYR